MPGHLSYGKSVLIAVDQLFNALCGGWPDETLSSRSHRRRLAGKPKIANGIDCFFRLFGENDHCRASYESERLGRQLPPEARP
ncbi:pseudouridine synthase [Mailhella sp.]|uniref:pseudouridine synthase n=1 Tax=Mailhella sp. TaxID=1981029 RepID=UPI004062BABF